MVSRSGNSYFIYLKVFNLLFLSVFKHQSFHISTSHVRLSNSIVFQSGHLMRLHLYLISPALGAIKQSSNIKLDQFQVIFEKVFEKVFLHFFLDLFSLHRILKSSSIHRLKHINCSNLLCLTL